MGIYPTGGATLDDIQGKLVAAQETGWSKFIPEGEGLFSFTAMNSSIRAVKLITEDYSYHSKTAKVPARDFFQSDRPWLN